MNYKSLDICYFIYRHITVYKHSLPDANMRRDKGRGVTKENIFFFTSLVGYEYPT